MEEKGSHRPGSRAGYSVSKMNKKSVSFIHTNYSKGWKQLKIMLLSLYQHNAKKGYILFGLSNSFLL
jgi:hypothetical protein